MASPVPGTAASVIINLVQTATVSVTPSGSDRVLIGGAIWRNSTVNPTVTFNTTETLTEVGTVATGSGLRALMFYRIAPTATTANVVFDWGAGEEPQGGVWACNWTGAHQTTPTAGFTSASGTNETPSIDVTSVVTDEATIDTMGTFAGSTSAVGAGQTALYADQSLGGGGVMRSSYDGSSTGTVTQSYTIPLDDWLICAMRLAAAAAGGGGGDPPPSAVTWVGYIG